MCIPACCECGEDVPLSRRNPLIGNYVCYDCQKKFPRKYKLVSKTQAVKDFDVPVSILQRLPHFERPNRFNKNAPVQLFLLSDVVEAARQIALLGERLGRKGAKA